MTGFADRAWTSSDGLALHARDYTAADGPARLPVICLHGLTRNARDFEALAPAIAGTGRRVLAVDVRGRGGSAWAPDPMTYVAPVYVRDVLEMAAALGVARAVVVGTSMGGLIAMGLALAAPAFLAAAAINDVGPVLAPAGLARIAGYAGVSAEVADWEGAAAYARATNAAAFPGYDPADWDRFARRLFREGADRRPVLDYDPAIAAPLRAAAGAPAPDLQPAWCALATGRPVLLVRGALSDLLAPETADAMAQGASDLTRVEVPGVGHAPTLEEPVAAEALARWLSRLG